MKIIPELMDAVKSNLVSTRPIPPGQVHTLRSDLEHVEHMVLQATCSNGDKEFQITMDEPEFRGGTSRSPTPLNYFLSGAGG